MNGSTNKRPPIPTADYTERHDRLVEAIGLIRQLWSGERISFAGRYFHTNALRLYDVPTTPPPIFVAAGRSKSAAPWPVSTATAGSPRRHDIKRSEVACRILARARKRSGRERHQTRQTR